MPVVDSRKHGVAEPTMQISIGRHGWQEQGGRQVGVYHQAWHEGACFGVGWLPFEISTEGTLEYLKQRLFPMAMMRENALQHYATRPEFIELDHETVRERNGFQTIKIECPYATRIKPGDIAVERKYIHLRGTGGYYIPAVPAYDDLLKSKVERVEAELRMIRIEAGHCYAAITSWARKELRDEERVATVHYKVSSARVAYCGSRSFGIATTEDETKTTCSRCLKALASDELLRKGEAAKKRDGEALATWLRERGKPATTADIKKGLGWDAKRLNSAYDAAHRDRTVGRDWSSVKTLYVVMTPKET